MGKETTIFEDNAIMLTQDDDFNKKPGAFRVYRKHEDDFKNQYWVQADCYTQITEGSRIIHDLLMKLKENITPPQRPKRMVTKERTGVVSTPPNTGGYWHEIQVDGDPIPWGTKLTITWQEEET